MSDFFTKYFSQFDGKPLTREEFEAVMGNLWSAPGFQELPTCYTVGFYREDLMRLLHARNWIQQDGDVTVLDTRIKTFRVRALVVREVEFDVVATSTTDARERVAQGEGEKVTGPVSVRTEKFVDPDKWKVRQRNW